MSIKDLDNLINELTLNLNKSMDIISLYDSNDWMNYYPSDEEFNNHKNTYGYYKKLIHINDQFELYLIFWSPFASSPIHDHPGLKKYIKVYYTLINTFLDNKKIKNFLNILPVNLY